MSSWESTAVLLTSYFHHEIPPEVPARNDGSLGWLSYLESPKGEGVVLVPLGSWHILNLNIMEVRPFLLFKYNCTENEILLKKWV